MLVVLKCLLRGGIAQNEPSSNFHWDGVYLDLVFRSFPQISQAPINKQRLTIQLNGTHVGTVSDITLHSSESFSLSDVKSCRCKVEVLFRYFNGGGEIKSG